MPRRVVLVLAFLLAGGCPVPSQNAQPPAAGQSQPPVFRTQARDVIVDVVVTTGTGETVNGLRGPDFQVLEDGKPQTIDFFEEHTAKKLPAGALPPLPKMPPGVFTNVPPAPEDDAVNILLLDGLNTPPQVASNARNGILGYLNHVKPGTRMAIVTLNDKLNFVQGFTTDAARLRAAVTANPAPGISPSLVTKSEIATEQQTETFINNEGAAGPGGASTGGAMLAAQAFANAFLSYQRFQGANRTRMTLEALSGIARYMAEVPGRKNLIWVAGEFPVVIFPKFDQRMQFESDVVPLSEIQKTADLLTAARVAVYPVYANGMMSDDIVSADNRSPGSAVSPGRMSEMSRMDPYIAESSYRAGLIASMNQLASDTGGKAAYNTNDLDSAIGRSLADGSHYYTVVYSPTNKKMDGHYRKIELKVADSKLKLSYRHGYNADELPPSDTRSRTNPLQPLLLRGMPASTQILYGVRVLPADPQPGPAAPRAGRNAQLAGPARRYSIDFMIRWTDVKLDAAPDGKHTGKIQMELMAYDREGKALNWTGGTQEMILGPSLFASIQKSGVPAHFEIDVPADKEVFLETGVYDWRTGKAGTLEVALPAGNAQTAAHDGEGGKSN